MRDIHYYDSQITNTLRHISNSPRIKSNDKSTIREVHDDLQARDVSQGRTARYLFTLKQITNMELKNTLKRLDKNDINRISKNIMHYAPSTKHEFRKALILISKLSKKNLPLIPMSRKNRKTIIPNFIEPCQVKEIIKILPGEPKTLTEFYWDTGCRPCEAHNLKCKDVMPDTHGIKVKLTGKTGDRIIRLIESEEQIKNHIKHKNPEDFVFDTKYLTYCRALKKAADRLNLNNVTPYTLRHSRVTHMGRYLTHSQKCVYFGWQPGSKMLRRYDHMNSDHLDTALLQMRHQIPAQRQNIPRICAAW